MLEVLSLVVELVLGLLVVGSSDVDEEVLVDEVESDVDVEPEPEPPPRRSPTRLVTPSTIPSNGEPVAAAACAPLLPDDDGASEEEEEEEVEEWLDELEPALVLRLTIQPDRAAGAAARAGPCPSRASKERAAGRFPAPGAASAMLSTGASAKSATASAVADGMTRIVCG